MTDKGLFTNYVSGQRVGACKILTMADKGGRKVGQVLTMDDKGGRGVRKMLTLADKGVWGSCY